MELYGQLPISQSQPAWLHGAIRATVTIGGNHYSRDAATFAEAAQKLRDELPAFFGATREPEQHERLGLTGYGEV